MLKSRPVIVAVLATTFTLASPVYFVVQTVLADQVGAAMMTAGLAFGVFALATLVTGLPRREEVAALGRRGRALAAAAGVLGIFGPQYLVLSHRYSDAPPGAEVLFFTTAVWGVLVMLAALLDRLRPTAAQVISGLLALMGVAAVLANWERPSSFSPFVRYPVEDLAMIAAGAGWAVFSVVVASLGRRHRARAFLPIATGASAVAALAVALVAPAEVAILSTRPELWVQLFVGACALAAMVIAWALLVASVGVAPTSGLLFIPAIVLTIFGVYERRMGTGGPSPLLWEAVSSGTAVTLAGAAGTALLSRRTRGAPEATDRTRVQGIGDWDRYRTARHGVTWGVAAIAVFATAISVYALAVPALSAVVQGIRGGGQAYSAEWTLPGAETPAVWIMFLASALILVVALSLTRGAIRPRRALTAAASAAIALASAPALLDTPLRTWTRWVPGEIQQDYGTEYARLIFTRVHDWPTTATPAMGIVAALALAIVAIVAMRQERGEPPQNGERERVGLKTRT